MKEQWMITAKKFLQLHKKNSSFLSRIVTRDEIWVHYYELESKSESMEWWQSKRKKKEKGSDGHCLLEPEGSYTAHIYTQHHY